MMQAVMVSDSTRRGLGITAGLDPRLARELGARCEELGYDSLWSNDEPAACGLDTLAQFAAVTGKADLGVGVLPLHRYTPEEIAAEVDRLGLDPARLWLGVGSGARPRQIDAIERAVAELRTLLPEETRIMVAAMRPRLCRLGGAIADGVLLNWMLPEQVARAREWVHEGAAEQGRPAPSSRPMCASLSARAVGGDCVRRRASIARSTRAIAGISRRWAPRWEVWGSQPPSGQRSLTRWPATTLCWSFRSCACWRTRTRPRSAPLRTRQHHEHACQPMRCGQRVEIAPCASTRQQTPSRLLLPRRCRDSSI